MDNIVINCFTFFSPPSSSSSTTRRRNINIKNICEELHGIYMIQKLVFGRGNEEWERENAGSFSNLSWHSQAGTAKREALRRGIFQKRKLLTCSFLLCEKDKLFLAFYLILLFQGFDLCRVNTIVRLLLLSALTNLFSMYATYLFIYFSTILMWLLFFIPWHTLKLCFDYLMNLFSKFFFYLLNICSLFHFSVHDFRLDFKCF